jgi:hypothetical protein
VTCRHFVLQPESFSFTLLSFHSGSSPPSGELPSWLRFTPSSLSPLRVRAALARCSRKGKALMDPSPPSGAGRTQPRTSSRFMAPACCAPPSKGRLQLQDLWHPPSSHYEQGADEHGWHRVTWKKKKRAWTRVSLKPSHQAGKVLADLIDLCFNCFSEDHIAKVCPNSSCCFGCGEPGHLA